MGNESPRYAPEFREEAVRLALITTGWPRWISLERQWRELHVRLRQQRQYGLQCLSVLVPLMVSRKTFSHPAACKASSWRPSVWSSVETLA